MEADPLIDHQMFTDKVDDILREADGIMLADRLSAKLMESTSLSARKQAKPIGLCLDLCADGKIQNEAISRCVGFGVDSLCIRSDLNRLDPSDNDQFIDRVMIGICSALRTAESMPNAVTAKRHFESLPNTVMMSPAPSVSFSDHRDRDRDRERSRIDEEEDGSSWSDADSESLRKSLEVESVLNSMASSAVKTAFDLKCSLIIVLTQSGRIARTVSKYRKYKN